MDRQTADTLRDVARLVDQYNAIIRAVPGYAGGEITILHFPETADGIVTFIADLHNRMDEHREDIHAHGAIEDAKIIDSYLIQLEDYHEVLANT